MWENSLKDVESDNNKILYETLLDLFLQRNGTDCLNKHRRAFTSFVKIGAVKNLTLFSNQISVLSVFRFR